MKKQLLVTIILLFSTLTIVSAQKRQITLEDIWQKYRFIPRSVSGFNFLNDGKHYTKQERTPNGPIVTKYDITSGEKVATVFEGQWMKEADSNLKGIFNTYAFSDDESKLF